MLYGLAAARRSARGRGWRRRARPRPRSGCCGSGCGRSPGICSARAPPDRNPRRRGCPDRRRGAWRRGPGRARRRSSGGWRGWSRCRARRTRCRPPPAPRRRWRGRSRRCRASRCRRVRPSPHVVERPRRWCDAGGRASPLRERRGRERARDKARGEQVTDQRHQRAPARVEPRSPADGAGRTSRAVAAALRRGAGRRRERGTRATASRWPARCAGR